MTLRAANDMSVRLLSLWLSQLLLVVATPEPTFFLGVFGPLTSDPRYLPTLAAFDIDFRKNHDEQVRARFGPPIVQIANLDPSLRFNMTLGTSDSDSDVAMSTAVDMPRGSGGYVRPTAMLAGADSEAFIPLSSVAAAHKVPLVSWSSSAYNAFTNSPYLMRTRAPTSMQAHCMWAWVTYFTVPSISFLYTHEQFGEDIFQAMLHLAAEDGWADSVFGVKVDHAPGSMDLLLVEDAIERMRNHGTRFLAISMGSVQANHILYGMEQEMMLYSGYQIIGSSSLEHMPTAPFFPSEGLPIGLTKILPAVQGPLYSEFVDLWKKMTADDVYGEEAAERYELARWRVAAPGNSLPADSTGDFQNSTNVETDDHIAFMFDAFYTVAMSISNLLQRGVEVRDIHGATLLSEMLNTSFEGVSGHVDFNLEDGTRNSANEVWNVQPNRTMVKVALHNPSIPSSRLLLLSDPYWAGGLQNRTPPSSLLACLDGFVADAATGACELCKRGVGCGYRHSDGFPIGIIGPWTTYSQEMLAAAVAFEIDVRKNYDPDARARFGPPAMNISNVNPRLRIKVQIGNDHGSDEIGLSTVLDWLLGNDDTSQVAAIVGTFGISISKAIASTAAVFKVPQVSYAPGEKLDQETFPYFTRVAGSLSTWGFVQWKYWRFLAFPQVTLWHNRGDDFGPGLYTGVADAAVADGESSRLFSVVVTFQGEQSSDLELAETSWQAVKDTGSRVLALAMLSTQSNVVMYAMEQEGVLEDYHLLGWGTFYSVTNKYKPKDGLPVGLTMLAEIPEGSLYPKFVELMSKMDPEDIYGDEAVQRYMLDRLKVPLSASTVPLVTAESLKNPTNQFSGRVFDAGYQVVHAINNLLNRGFDETEILGDVLLQEILTTTFEGATGMVQLDPEGERRSDFVIYNHQPDPNARSIPRNIGMVSAATGIALHTSDPFWPRGTQSSTPPSFLFDCFFGFLADTETRICEPCKAGFGCGYRPSDGFPLGLIGPFTSYSHDHLAAAIAFDLDFRKNFDPDIRARFGDPIVNISNLDERLRIKLQIGTSHSDALVGMNTALDWFLGNAGFSQVVGIIGGFDSEITMAIASNGAVFEVPQVGWGSTNAGLADKSLYPYFVRTSPSDGLEGRGQWAWAIFFGVPAVSYFYTRDPYGEGLFKTVRDIASGWGQSQRLIVVGIESQLEAETYDLEVCRAACGVIRSSGTKFVIMSMVPEEANPSMYVMEQEGMLDSYQILGSAAVLYMPNHTYTPTNGFPIGFQKFWPRTRGVLFPEFAKLWMNMTTDDLYGPEAIERYMLDQMRIPLSASPAPASDATFVDAYAADAFTSMVFDAGYTFVLAINSLLNSGLDPSDIYGSVLMEEVKKTSFEGVSGPISFDEAGDRGITYGLWNWQPSESSRRLQSVYASAGSGLEARMVGLLSADGRELRMVEPSGAIYWIGGAASSTIPEFLTSCDPGKEWDESTGACKLCTNGFFSLGGNKVSCMPCAAGTTSSVQRTECIACGAGQFSALVGRNCSACPKGTYGDTQGLAECKACPVEYFADELGLTECKRCGQGKSSIDSWTTMTSLELNGVIEYSYYTGADSEDFCGCDRGHHYQAGECWYCGEGMTCRGMGTLEIDEGYFSEAVLSVYKCHGDTDRCTGGLPGATCAPGRKGKTCAECEDGMTPGKRGSCKDCDGSDAAPFIMASLTVAAGLVLVYHLIDTQNRVTQSHALLLCAIAVGQFVTVTQQLSVVGMLNVVWEDPVLSFLRFISVLTFNVEVLRMNCVSTMSAVERYLGKVCVILVCLAFMVTIHLSFVVGRHGGKFWDRMPSLIGSIGTLFMIFYISVTTTVLEPLQCQDHPNGKWTIRNYQGIVCWETEEHRTMLMVGALAFFLVPVAYLVGCAWVVWQLPTRMKNGDSAFLKAFAFLFFRFRAKRHGYVIAQMGRSFLVASVLAVHAVELQVILLLAILLAAYSLTLYTMPWRVHLANVLDCFFGVCTLLLVCVAGLFIDEQDKNLNNVAHYAVVLVVISLLPAPMAIGYGLYKRFARPLKPFQFFLCHHKAAAGAFTRLLKMHLLDSGKTNGDVFIDSDNLETLDNLFEFVGNDTRNLCVVGSDEIFLRPWCLGEMCTARLQKVNTMVLATASFRLPIEELISNLADMVNNLEVLIESGMSIEMLQETLRCVAEIPPIWMPAALSWTVMTEAVSMLLASQKKPQGGRVSAVTSTGAALAGKKVIIVYDALNLEATASSMALQKMINPHLTPTPNLLAALLDHDALPESTSVCICICTNGAFDRAQYLTVLVQTSRLPRAASLIPVLADANFQIPCKEFLKQWEQLPPSGVHAGDIQKLIHVIMDLFKQIATTFQPHHASEDVLKVGASALSKRLLALGGGSSSKIEKSKETSTPHMTAASTTEAGERASTRTNLLPKSQTDGTCTAAKVDQDDTRSLSMSGDQARPRKLKLGQQVELIF